MNKTTERSTAIVVFTVMEISLSLEGDHHLLVTHSAVVHLGPISFEGEEDFSILVHYFVPDF